MATTKSTVAKSATTKKAVKTAAKKVTTKPKVKKSELLVNTVAKLLKGNRGRKNAITNEAIRTKLADMGIKNVHASTVRAAIRTIRINGIVNGLLSSASSSQNLKGGYYVSTSKTEIQDYVDDMKRFESNVRLMRRSFEKFLKK